MGFVVCILPHLFRIRESHSVGEDHTAKSNSSPACIAYSILGLGSSIRQILQGSFSAVSKPNFSRKYAFESSRRDLHNALLCTALQSHFFCQNFAKILRFFSETLLNKKLNFAKVSKIFGNFLAKNAIRERCKGVHCVDLSESFQTHIFLQNLASIQPRTNPVKFARSS